MCGEKDRRSPFHGSEVVGAAAFCVEAIMKGQDSGNKKKKSVIATNAAPSGQKHDDDVERAAATEPPAAHTTAPEHNYDGLTVLTLRSELRNRSLAADGNKTTLIERLKAAGASSKVTGDEGLSGASRESSPLRAGSAIAPAMDTSELPSVGVGNELVQLPASPETATGVSPPADVVGDPTGSENSGWAPAEETLTLEGDVGNSSGLDVSATSPGADNVCLFY